MWFAAIVTDLFLVFYEISDLSDFCENHRVAHAVKSRTKTDQVDIPSCDHEKERSVVNPRGPLRFMSLFLLNHCYVIFEISNAFWKNRRGWLKINQIISGS